MLKSIDKVERYVVYVLVFMLLVSVILDTLELSRALIKSILESPLFFWLISTDYLNLSAFSSSWSLD
jgi:hypothetical protein